MGATRGLQSRATGVVLDINMPQQVSHINRERTGLRSGWYRASGPCDASFDTAVDPFLAEKRAIVLGEKNNYGALGQRIG
jgi:hypothetical protein